MLSVKHRVLVLNLNLKSFVKVTLIFVKSFVLAAFSLIIGWGVAIVIAIAIAIVIVKARLVD